MRKRYSIEKNSLVFAFAHLLLSLLLYAFLSFTVNYLFPELLSGEIQSLFFAIIVLGFAFFYPLIVLFVPHISPVLKRNLNVSVVIGLVLLFFVYENYVNGSNWIDQALHISSVVLILILVFSLIIWSKFNDESVPLWLWPSVAILFLLTFGTIIAFGLAFPERGEIGLRLNYCEDTEKKAGITISCSAPVYAFESKDCEISPNIQLDNITWNVVDLQNMPREQVYNTSQFLAPRGFNSVYLTVRATEDNRSLCYSSYHRETRHFPTYEEYLDFKRQFAYFFFPFVAFVIGIAPKIYRRLT